MIRQSVAFKTSLYIFILVLSMILALFLTISQLFSSHVFQQLLAGQVSIVEQTVRYAQWMFALAATGVTLVSAGFAVILSNRLARPLVEMEKATKDIAQGAYHTRVQVQGEDEIAKLGDAINQLAETLQHLDVTRKQFLADVSHELRTPLSYIHGYSQVLLDGMGTSENDRQTYLQIIFDESARIEKLISNLFALAQMDEGTFRVEKSWVDVNALVQRVVRHIRPRAEERGLEVQFQTDLQRNLRVDEIRMEQVLLNLADNAIRYSRAGDTLSIEVRDQDGCLELSIADTGPGIPADDLVHIWDRLYRVEKSRSRASGGAGLGLAIVKEIVRLHGGDVRMRSSIGMGTIVTIRIPMSEDENGVRDE